MRKILSLALTVLTVSVASSALALPTAYYNPVTGAISLGNDTGGVLGALSVTSPNSVLPGMDDSAFATIPGATLSNDFADGFTYLAFPATPAGAAGAISIGSVVTPNTPASELVVKYRVSLTTGGAASTGSVVVVAVPEPASIGLAGLGLVGFAVRRRRAA